MWFRSIVGLYAYWFVCLFAGFLFRQLFVLLFACLLNRGFLCMDLMFASYCLLPLVRWTFELGCVYSSLSLVPIYFHTFNKNFGFNFSVFVCDCALLVLS